METVAIRGYDTIRLLGSGQYGDVYLVQRQNDRLYFAAKVTRPLNNAQELALAQKEANILRTMCHRNIIQCIETIQINRQLVIVMEYASGGDLDDYIRGFSMRREMMSECEVVRIFIQIVLAISYLHDRHILHRDLKPQNIILTEHGVIKVSDFGVSRSLQHTMDAAETVTGTPIYMAPELLENRPYNAKGDIWSLGCILHQLTTGAPPFQHRALGALVMQIVREKPPPLPAMYSVGLRSLAVKLLEKNPQNRPDAKDILSTPFIQLHLMALASRATMLQSKVVPDRAAEPSITQMNTPLNIAKPINSPFRPSRTPDAQTRQVELARQMFHENQAAARRNKQRADEEKRPSPDLMEFNTTVDEKSQNRKSPDPVHIADCAQYNYYLENARAAKLNKQRALEDQSPPTPFMLDPIENDSKAKTLSPPPPLENARSYEELLEIERKRVHEERKELQARMQAMLVDDDKAIVTITPI